jgi:hypothetical protein
MDEEPNLWCFRKKEQRERLLKIIEKIWEIWSEEAV